jgi:hypothetical protein
VPNRGGWPARSPPLADDIPELVAELRLRNDRIRRLEADLAAGGN